MAWESSWGTTPHGQDTINTLLKRIASSASGGGGGGGGSATNNQSGAGSPVGVKTPAYVGQGYTDTVAPYHQWFATGLTSADWFGIV